MKKKIIALSFMAMVLTACEPSSRSMGAALMPAPLTHRVSAADTTSKATIDVSGFWANTSSDYNIKDMNAGGGNLGFSSRLWGPFFANVAAGAFGGTLKFACSGSDCTESSFGDEGYRKWLKTSEGEKSYSFFNIQERVLAGVDFDIGPFFFIGVAGGVQLFQGASDFDDVRGELDDLRLVNDEDGKYGVAGTSSVWLGSRLGRQGQYGLINAEWDILYKGDIDMWTSTTKFTYAHPSGFYGGAALGDLMSLTIFAGKIFTL